MKDVAEKFIPVERAIATAKGPFNLFALVLREDLPDAWDLLVSATWAARPSDLIEAVVAQVKETLGKEQLVALSRIIAAPPDSPAVRALNSAMRVEHSVVEVEDSNFFGLPIKHAFIISSCRPESVAKKAPVGQTPNP